MFRLLKNTIKSGVVTTKYPKKPDIAPVGFRGKPEIDSNLCTFCGDCVNACLPGAIYLNEGEGSKSGINERIITLDCGGCIFCGLCEVVCKYGAIKLTQEYELASKTKENLTTEIRRKL